jgi:hypothetical protein
VKSGNVFFFIQKKIIQQVELIARVLTDLKTPLLETRFAAHEKVVRTLEIRTLLEILIDELKKYFE